MNETVASIVVTFNRPQQLIEGIEGILEQSRMPDRLYIIDNQSNSETFELLYEKGWLKEKPTEADKENQLIITPLKISNLDNPEFAIHYIRMAKNEGGAGGFYTGMKAAFDDGFQWLWMMDDDGVPAIEQLNELLYHSDKSNLLFSNALVTSIYDQRFLAFDLNKFQKTEEVTEQPVLKGIVAAFNGTLISRKVVEEIGFIKREMFIWGDETEYINRVRKNNFEIGTITTAIHRHPMMKGKRDNVLPFTDKYKIVVKPKHFSHFYYRNLGYNTATYANKKAVNALFILYVTYFFRKGDFKELVKFNRYFKNGTQNKFD
jgi:rhamnopyranosyl-N-acetylglucosaminyl-diphospho-decaprenol beta-1,3/1,4-galactofuranosyltransferase